MFASHPKLGQLEHCLHLSVIVHQAQIARFHVAELTFDHAERMLNGRTNRRLDTLDSAITAAGNGSQHALKADRPTAAPGIRLGI